MRRFLRFIFICGIYVSSSWASEGYSLASQNIKGTKTLVREKEEISLSYECITLDEDPHHQTQGAFKNESIVIGFLDETIQASEGYIWSYDKREKTKDTWSYPYNCAFPILVGYKNHEKKFHGTAFLIQSGVALTAAHNIFLLSGSHGIEYFLKQMKPELSFDQKLEIIKKSFDFKKYYAEEVDCYFGSCCDLEQKEIKGYFKKKVLAYCFLSDFYTKMDDIKESNANDFALLFLMKMYVKRSII